MSNNRNESLTQSTLTSLKEDFVIVGRTRVRPWQAWLSIGLTIGIFAAVMGTVNQSGQFSAGLAAGETVTIVSPNGGETLVIGGNVLISWQMSKIGTRDLQISLVSVPKTNTQPIFVYGIATVKSNLLSYSWMIPGWISPGSYKISLCIIDSKGCKSTDTSDASFNIMTPISITTADLPSGSVGISYSAQINSSGASSDAKWSLSSGVLPAGLIFLTTPIPCATPVPGTSGGCFAPSGYISGTPTTAGTYAFTVTVTSGTQSASKQFTISIVAPPSITVLSPNGGEIWSKGTVQTIKWTTSNIPDSQIISIGARGFGNFTVIGEDGLPHIINEKDFSLIDSVNSGSANYTVNLDPGTYMLFTKTVVNGNIINDFGDGKFNIVAPAPSITVLSPNGGESWQKGSAQMILWKPASASCLGAICAQPAPLPVSIYLMTYTPPCNNPTICPLMPVQAFPIAISTSDNGAFEWHVGEWQDLTGSIQDIQIPDGQYVIQISNGSQLDTSDAPFSIVAPSIYDLNADGKVDNADVYDVADAITHQSSSNYYSKSDFNKDGQVNVVDLYNIRNNVMNTSGPKVYYDLNLDGVLDNKDVKIVTDGTTQTYVPYADIQVDGQVNVVDLYNIRNNVMNTSGPKVYYDLNLDGVLDNKDVKVVTDGMTSFMTQAYIPYADLNFDNRVDVNDLSMIRNFIYSNVGPKVFYDLNLDGAVNSIDVKIVSDAAVPGVAYSPYADVSVDGRVDQIDVQAITNNSSSI